MGWEGLWQQSGLSSSSVDRVFVSLGLSPAGELLALFPSGHGLCGELLSTPLCDMVKSSVTREGQHLCPGGSASQLGTPHPFWPVHMFQDRHAHFLKHYQPNDTVI